MWLLLFLFISSGSTQNQATSVDIGGVISGNKMAGVPLGRSLGDGELDVEGVCSGAAIACQNCSLVVSCVPLPMGYLKVPLHECPEGCTCNAHLGGCSKTPVPECNPVAQKYQHYCEQVGIFPDAFNCRKFHLCSPPEDIPDGRPASHRAALCPRHYGYNTLTAQCSIKLKNGQCEGTPVPKCENLGQMGTLPSSPNHYYVCLLKSGSIYPQVFICPHGWFFWDGFCRPEPNDNVVEKKIINDEATEIPDPKENEIQTREKKGENPINRLEALYTTEKTTTYVPDTFLADKFDLSYYETISETAYPPEEEFSNYDDWFMNR